MDGRPQSISSEIISKVSEKVKLDKKPIKFCWPNSYTPTTHALEKSIISVTKI